MQVVHKSTTACKGKCAKCFVLIQLHKLIGPEERELGGSRVDRHWTNSAQSALWVTFQSPAARAACDIAPSNGASSLSTIWMGICARSAPNFSFSQNARKNVPSSIFWRILTVIPPAVQIQPRARVFNARFPLSAPYM